MACRISHNDSIICWLLLILGMITVIYACNETSQEYDPYPNGKCPSGTSWNDTVNCCVGCLVCGAGFKKAPDCLGPCVSCPEQNYSQEEDNWECFPCTRCENLHRSTDSRCSPARNTRCGKCLDGFVEHPDLVNAPITTIRCLKNDANPPPNKKCNCTCTNNCPTVDKFYGKGIVVGLTVSLVVVLITCIVLSIYSCKTHKYARDVIDRYDGFSPGLY